ncbi:MAG: KR domain-containing protein, partial [Actinomycetota bacterium]|nr:KR domain-containing protein [Actinomycetota bacterium]
PPATATREDSVTGWIVATAGHPDVAALGEALGGAALLALDGAGDIDDALAAAVGDAPTERLGVVFVASAPSDDTDATTMATAQVAQVGALLRLAAALDRRGESTLWVVTGEAHLVMPGDLAAGFANTTLWGAGRAIGEELPHLWGGCIDHADPLVDAAPAIAHELTHVAEGGPVEGEVALRGGERHVARLVAGSPSQPAPLHLGGDSTTLVSGGFGAVGREVARWLVGQGARRLVLLGRTALPARAEWPHLAPESAVGRRAALVRELESMGAAVHVATVDVADEPALRTFLDEFRADGWPPVRSVFHAAAQFGGELIADVSDDFIRAQMLPKLIGASTFHQMPEIEHLVLFSSLAAVLPMAGQSAYAAGNAFLDGLADHRAASGLPVVSINWGFWEGSDEATVDDGRNIKDTANALAIDQGMRGFRTEQGLDAMGRVMVGATARAVVVPIDWAALGAARLSPVAGLAADRVAEAAQLPRAADAGATRRTLVELLAAAPGSDRAVVAEA